jgi:DNA-binding protein HU-beta
VFNPYISFSLTVGGGFMTKAELIEKVAKDAGLTKSDAGKAVQSFLEGLTQGLKKRNSKVTLVGFGTFKKVYRKTRMGRNPQTGEKIKIKGKNAITFKASKKIL